MIMSKNKKIKQFFDLLEINDNYISHIANGLDQTFFYLEFENKTLDYYEMYLSLLREKAIFYEIDIHQIICYLDGICSLLNKHHIYPSTKNNIVHMKSMIDDVIQYIDWYKVEGSWCSKEESGEDDPNNTIVGYYLNHKWQSDVFPSNIIDKIFSADKYTTLLNENRVIMIAMEHKRKKSLFYSMNDQ